MPRVPLLHRVSLRRPGRRGLAAVGVVVSLLGGVLAFASPFYVQHTSMESTLQPGELLLVDRVSTALGLQRGEIILFKPPIDPPGQLFVKRVVGLPGETVAIHDGHVYVDGVQLAEPYLPSGETTTVDDPAFQVKVPRGQVFVLGDNRTGSWDSRGFGCVPTSSIVGQAWVGVLPAISLAFL